MITQTLSQKQQLRITPNQVEFLNLLHLNLQQLELKISNELIENPFLEQREKEEKEETPTITNDMEEWNDQDDHVSHKKENAAFFPGPAPDFFVPDEADFRQELREQLQMITNVSPEEIRIALLLVDSFNDNGLLESSLEEMADDISFIVNRCIDERDINNALALIRSLGSPSIGARNSRECLLLQLKSKSKKNSIDNAAIDILENHAKEFFSASFDKLKKDCKLDDEELKIVLAHISKLKLKPICNSCGKNDSKLIYYPEFQVIEENGKLSAQLTKTYTGTLYINRDFLNSFPINSLKKNNDKATIKFIKSKLQSARQLIKSIEEREHSMLSVMNAILETQAPYFYSGDISLLKPMVLNDIVKKTNLSIATVSRSTSEKSADTLFGIIPLKKLFSQSLTDKDGSKLSNQAVKNEIMELIRNEDKENPLMDKDIVLMLLKKGIVISRRTVVKYRSLLNIPVAHLRKMNLLI